MSGQSTKTCTLHQKIIKMQFLMKNTDGFQWSGVNRLIQIKTEHHNCTRKICTQWKGPRIKKTMQFLKFIQFKNTSGEMPILCMASSFGQRLLKALTNGHSNDFCVSKVLHYVSPGSHLNIHYFFLHSSRDLTVSLGVKTMGHILLELTPAHSVLPSCTHNLQW